MIEIQDLHDLHDRKTVKISQAAEDGSSLWSLILVSGDLPPAFINSPKRDVELSIIDLSDMGSDTQQDSMLLPVVLAGTVTIGDKTKYFYRQKYDNRVGISPGLTLDCFVTKGQEASETLENPAILILFKVNAMTIESNTDTNLNTKSDDVQMINGNTTQPSADVNLDVRSGREHVDLNENANGGLDLPKGDSKNDQAEQSRENKQFDYDNMTDGKPGVKTVQDA